MHGQSSHVLPIMASIQRYRNGYRAQICVLGVRESQVFRTKREATAWAEVRSIELRRNQLLPDSNRFSLGDALLKYRDTVSPSKRGHLWEAIRIDAMMLDPAFPSSCLLSDLSPDTLGRWRDERLKVVKPGTVLREIGLVSAILEAARQEWRWIDANPMRSIRKPAKPAHRDILLSLSQIRAILKECRYSQRPVRSVSQAVAVCFLLALRTGMRAGELTGLTWARVHHNYVILPVTKTVPRNVPLSGKARRLIEKMRGYDPVLVFGISSQSLDANFRKYRDRAGIAGITFHDSRHYAATHLSRKLDVLDLCRMFGWSSTSQALTYYNPSASDIARRLDG